MPPSRRTSARASVSLNSELLPEPLTPVTQTSAESGNRTVTLLRLLVVTPSIAIERVAATRRRCSGRGIRSRPARYRPVSESVVGDLRGRALGDDSPAVPPRPGPEVHQPVGPRHDGLVVLDDDDRIAARLEAARASISRRLLRGCSPIDGSSST